MRCHCGRRTFAPPYPASPAPELPPSVALPPLPFGPAAPPPAPAPVEVLASLHCLRWYHTVPSLEEAAPLLSILLKEQNLPYLCYHLGAQRRTGTSRAVEECVSAAAVGRAVTPIVYEMFVDGVNATFDILEYVRLHLLRHTENQRLPPPPPPIASMVLSELFQLLGTCQVEPEVR